jgi:hypothetical protein
MREAAILLLAASLAACSGTVPEVRPSVGQQHAYLQTFRITDRTSGGEELPSITITRRVTLSCTASGADTATFDMTNGDVAVWIDEDTGDADFVATDAGAATREFADEESDLATMYAALWATSAHAASEVTVDRLGRVRGLEGRSDRAAPDEDPSTDLGGSFLESLVADASLLFATTDQQGNRNLQFRLAHWNASFKVAADVEHGDAGRHTFAYESRSGGQRDGPFLDLTLLIAGDAGQAPETGLLHDAVLTIDVSADVPTGPSGGTRRDAAKLEYTLQRAEP